MEVVDSRKTYTVREAAGMFGVGLTLFRRLIRDGSVPTIRLGTRVLIPRAAIERLLDVQPADDTAA